MHAAPSTPLAPDSTGPAPRRPVATALRLSRIIALALVWDCVQTVLKPELEQLRRARAEWGKPA